MTVISQKVGQTFPTNNAKVHDSLKQEKHKSEDQIRQVAHEFEAIFLETVLKSMRQSIHKSGLINGGNAEEIYRGMLDSEYSKTMSQTGQTGLADMIFKQLLHRSSEALPQEESPAAVRNHAALSVYKAVKHS
ncbi:MAG: rod-binding protein [Deltaproteobacteria bacterium]|nr:rod-binding protein [Deltaproteobacteria bacterium]